MAPFGNASCPLEGRQAGCLCGRIANPEAVLSLEARARFEEPASEETLRRELAKALY